MTAADRLVRDPWFQAFLALSLLGSIAAAYSELHSASTPLSTSAAPQPLVTPPVPPAAAPTGDARQSYPVQPAVAIAVVTKATGTWIVDQKPSADRDTDSVIDAVKRSGPGDIILIRPGRYPGGLDLEHALSIRGLPAPGEPVVLETVGKPVIAQRWGESRIQDVELEGKGMEPKGGSQSETINQYGGRLSLTRVRVTAESGVGAFAFGGSLEVKDSTFTASETGILVASNLTCDRCTLLHNDSGIRVMQQAVDVKITRSLFKENELGLMGRTGVGVADSHFVGNKRGIQLWDKKSVLVRVIVEGSRSHNLILQEKAEASVSDSDFLTGGNGITLWGETRLDLRDSRIRSNRDAGISASGRSRAKVNGCELSGNNGQDYQFFEKARWEGGKNTPPLPRRR